MRGKIAFINDKSCFTNQKMLYAQQAGAIGVIMVSELYFGGLRFVLSNFHDDIQIRGE
jgi:hypothetical protein